MHIRRAQSRAVLWQFIELPYRHYRHDPLWVPPLRDEQRSQFHPKRNPMLDYCEYALFLLLDGAQVTGRIAAFIDNLALDYWGWRRWVWPILFGLFILTVTLTCVLLAWYDLLPI